MATVVFRMLRKETFWTVGTLALGLLGLLGSSAHAADSLYVGDDSDYSVKRFDAETGAFLGTLVNSGSGGVNGLRGLLFEHPGAGGCGDLLLVDQNVNFNLNGEVLRYDGKSGRTRQKHRSGNSDKAPQL